MFITKKKKKVFLKYFHLVMLELSRLLNNKFLPLFVFAGLFVFQVWSIFTSDIQSTDQMSAQEMRRRMLIGSGISHVIVGLLIYFLLTRDTPYETLAWVIALAPIIVHMALLAIFLYYQTTGYFMRLV